MDRRTDEAQPIRVILAEDHAFVRERAQLVGGTLRVRSRPGAGTRVDLDVPD